MALFTLYNDFTEALERFRYLGGAMMYYPPDSQNKATWMVTYYDELTEQGIDPRISTELALARGGLSQQQIANELSDWHE